MTTLFINKKFISVVCCDGDIRLENGSAVFTGRLEVCLLGMWGAVCDDDFIGVDASVACGQLGFYRSGQSYCTAFKQLLLGKMRTYLLSLLRIHGLSMVTTSAQKWK